MRKQLLSGIACSILIAGTLVGAAPSALASSSIGSFVAKHPHHVRGNATRALSSGLTPSQVRAVYNLPSSGGGGTIAIIDAYDAPTIESDLATFDKQFSLPSCTTANGCFEKHIVDSGTRKDSGWAEEASLDVEWAHAIAPSAKILLVEAKTASGNNLLNAVDYARKRSGVVAVSMSWGGAEFSSAPSLDSHFTSSSGAVFFASSGDGGSGVSWPAVSSNVIGVGGTTPHFSGSSLSSETAWSGSGGGLSIYFSQPNYQASFGVPQANGKRAVPDVSYMADPNPGFAVYDNGWLTIGGTSAGAPQWAAISSLGNVNASKLYSDAGSSKYGSVLHDIVSGSNGSCTYFCSARKNYDYITGLGSPLATSF